MLVFSTRIPLMENVSSKMCSELFIKWVAGSPRYSMNDLSYERVGNRDFQTTSDSAIFSITNYSDEQKEVVACRLCANDNGDTWTTDCVFLDICGDKSVQIQLDFISGKYTVHTKSPHKPYIVKLFMESGYCANDATLPVTDLPIEVGKENMQLCIDIIKAKTENTMPVIYVSCDYWDNTYVDVNMLARRMGGVAHVFYETDYRTSWELKEPTNSQNVYNGYIGIYFPRTLFHEQINPKNYSSADEVTNEIERMVWQVLVNSTDSSSYNWNSIKVLQAQRHITELKDDSTKLRERFYEQLEASGNENEQLQSKVTELLENVDELSHEKDLFCETFDVENRELRERNTNLYRENASLRMQIDGLQRAIKNADSSGVLCAGAENDLYPGEQNDLLLSILEQVKSKYEENSRAHHIIDSLLAANEIVGTCKRVLDAVEQAFAGNGRLNSSSKSQLRSVGFEIQEEGAHYKIVFNKDPRYTFIASKTPSDYREGLNLIADIRNSLDIMKKI